MISLNDTDLLIQLQQKSDTDLWPIVFNHFSEAYSAEEDEQSQTDVQRYLHVAVTALIQLGERKLERIEHASDRDSQFKSWNSLTKEFARWCRMPHEIFDQVESLSTEELRSWAIIAAQTFCGGNPGVEMHPDFAEERRLEALNILSLVQRKVNKND